MKMLNHEIVKVTAADEDGKETNLKLLFVLIVKLKLTTTVMVVSYKWYCVKDWHSNKVKSSHNEIHYVMIFLCINFNNFGMIYTT